MDVSFVRNLDELYLLDNTTISAVVIEPLIQGVNQMHLWPTGMLKQLRNWCNAKDVHLILDEVMTGFGRSGTMFACEQEDVIPDFLCLAKGLTGGYLPLAATMTTDAIYRAFLGSENTFYYGHSYTANPLGCAAALANLQLFKTENTLADIRAKSDEFGKLLEDNFSRHVIRRCGMMSGIEVRQNNGSPYAASEQVGARICYAARNHGLLTRPIRDTIVLMPPLCSTIEELRYAVNALSAAMEDVCGA
jgi:adenosylmethionine-8-amino-7-oxononanoate aminotransferase